MGIHISPTKGLLKMTFLFQRLDMLVPGGYKYLERKGIFKTGEALQPHSILHILSPF